LTHPTKRIPRSGGYLRIALIAPPFIPVPPKQYGGTELFIAQLASGLKLRAADVTVYTNGESRIDVNKRWLFEKSEWPIKGDIYNHSSDSIHTAWALQQAASSADIIHINNATGVMFSRFLHPPMVCTLHHPLEAGLTTLYRHFNNVQYVCISHQQRAALGIGNAAVVHHGLDTSLYELRKVKKNYLSFLGRIAPVKGVHIAIEVARRSGIPLKIAGEIQPAFQDYFDSQIKPAIDGRFIEYVGEVGLEAKNDLLGDSLAMLFPIQWDEPFGLVMIEAMACGTPVLALPGGSVSEVVKNGVSGFVTRDSAEMADHAQKLITSPLDPVAIRSYVEENFSTERMVSEYLDLYKRLLGRSNSEQESAVA
jgi:glycosyltransferase involved in cell wall biosynthesis